MKNAMLLAEETVNQEGGIHGRPLEVIFADTQGRASLAESVVKELTEDRKALMLVGGYSSDATFSLAKTAERRDVPFVVCTASADRITQMGWKNIYRINPPVSEYTQGLFVVRHDTVWKPIRYQAHGSEDGKIKNAEGEI